MIKGENKLFIWSGGSWLVCTFQVGVDLNLILGRWLFQVLCIKAKIVLKVLLIAKTDCYCKRKKCFEIDECDMLYCYIMQTVLLNTAVFIDSLHLAVKKKMFEHLNNSATKGDKFQDFFTAVFLCSCWKGQQNVLLLKEIHKNRSKLEFQIITESKDRWNVHFNTLTFSLGLFMIQAGRE